MPPGSATATGRSAISRGGLPTPFAERDLDYLETVHPPLADVLQEMLKAGRADNIPIVNPAVGRFLRVLATVLAPKRTVEVGTAIGFSTVWIASGLPEGSRIDTIDPDRSRTERARRYWIRAGVSDKIRVLNEPALRALPRMAPGIELAFIDALKPEYREYLDLLLQKMTPGGVITVDNLLWSGRIAAGAHDPDTDALRAFNEYFVRHGQLDATILPVGDGLGFGVVRPHAS